MTTARHMQGSSSTHIRRESSQPWAWLGRHHAWMVALAGVYLLLWYAWFIAQYGGPDFQTIIRKYGLLPMEVAVGVVTYAGARRAKHPRLRAGLSLVAAGFLAHFTGDILWIRGDWLSRWPTFSPVEPFFGLSFGLLLAGLVRLRSPDRSVEEAVGLWLDSGLVMALGAMAMWLYVVAPALKANLNLLTKVVTMGGPLLTLSLLHATTVLLLESRSPRARRAYLLMGLGVMLEVFSSVMFLGPSLGGTYIRGGRSDAFTITALYLFLLGAHLAPAEPDQSQGADEEPRVSIASALPYAGAAGAYAHLLWVAYVSPVATFRAAAWFSGLVTGIVLLRQVLVIRENRLLLRRSVSLNQQLCTSESRFRSMLQHSSDVISILDSDGTILYQTPSGSRIFGDDLAEKLGTPFIQWVHPGDQPLVADLLRGLRAHAGDVRMERWRMLSTKAKRWSHTENVITNLLSDPDVQGFMLNTRDVTDRTRLEEEMRRRAYTDPLTGLANRRLFRERLEQAIANGPFSVLLLDLDEFKNVNDSLGHDAGDQLLVEVAARLSRIARPNRDTVARLGGDEFAVILAGSGDADGVRLASDIITALLMPVRISGKEVSVFTTIGVTSSDRSGQSADGVLRDADVAMYAAKAQGKGRYCLFEPHMLAAAVRRMEMEADMRTAVTRGDFVIRFQPELAFGENRVLGFEALVRWQHPAHGLLSPSEFIPLAEEAGLIREIDRLVLQEACALASRLQLHFDGEEPPFIAVNLSGSHSLTPDLPELIARVLGDNGLHPRSLVLEITESSLIGESARTGPLLAAIRRLGVRIAVDDFGIGYSALSYLNDLPIDILKIDQSYIRAMTDGVRQQALVKGIIDLAHALGMCSVAEGIETEEQERLLKAMGCMVGQGYRYSAPISGAAVMAQCRNLRLPYAHRHLVHAGVGDLPS
ncbi:MAG TPA: EAL domain-containing protein [Symbiobacteriaceae bacterium]|nr:EAL domain-containing protein [Symbiobacteriaceae bacterium]